MARCYSAHGEALPRPRLLLLSDARNDATLERALGRLPRGSGLVFRHYHLAPAARRVRFGALRRLAGGTATPFSSRARRWRRGHGARTGLPRLRGWAGASGLRLATAHDLAELRDAARAGADAVLLSRFRDAQPPARACWDRSGSTCSRRCRACR
jgi:thiamine-phosphate pyrophosphorylase